LRRPPAAEPARAPLLLDEAKRLKLDRPRIRRAERMAPVAESQRAVHYCGQVVFDRTRLNRHKKLAAAVLGDVLRRTRRAHRYWSHRCFRKSTPAAVGLTSLWVKLKRVSCALDTVFELAPSS